MAPPQIRFYSFEGGSYLCTPWENASGSCVLQQPSNDKRTLLNFAKRMQVPLDPRIRGDSEKITYKGPGVPCAQHDMLALLYGKKRGEFIEGCEKLGEIETRYEGKVDGVVKKSSLVKSLRACAPEKGSEEEKARRKQFLLHTLDKLLKALHPFMPFITEEIWSKVPWSEGKLLMVEKWPQ